MLGTFRRVYIVICKEGVLGQSLVSVAGGAFGEWYLHMDFLISGNFGFQTCRADSAVKFDADHFKFGGLSF